MTYGGDTYGGAAIGSTSTEEIRAVATASSSSTATATATGTASPVTTATSTTTATTTATGALLAATEANSQTSVAITTTSVALTTGTASAQSTATTAVTDATLEQSAVEWRVTRDETEVIDSVFDVDPVVDTANPFGDYAVAKMDDRGGELFDKFSRGTRIDIAYSTNGGISFTNKFTGYVVEPRETEQSGADVLEVEAYSFDQFLRRNTVSNDQSGNLISQALKDIIQTDTPVSYVAANVTVGDDQTLTRSYQGESVETVLRDLAFKSNNENFGVNDDLEFFFRPRETVHIDRGVDDTQWFNYDIPELGKETINEVEVWFADGNESVIVDDGTDKLDLQDSLGLPSPGTQRAELNRPLITDIGDAEDIGRKYLKFRNSTLSGTVTTFGLFDAEPGDTIDITITPRGIDAEFVIAATEYRWGRDQTILTIVEKRGDVDDILSELNDSVQRQEMQSADRTASKNRITTTNATGIVSINAVADGRNADADRFVNDGRNLVRDGWIGLGNPDIATIVVGDDNGGLSRSNASLGNQTNSGTVSESLPDAKTVRYEATITQTGVAEIGLETSGGTLISRATFDTPIDIDGTVSFDLTVSNDGSVSRGVLTDAGQTAVRDILADNSPAIPTDYAYGSDGSAVSESDTALGNELVSVSLNNLRIQDADTQSEWDAILPTIQASDPLVVDSTGPRVAQSCWTQEGESGTSNTASFSNASGGESTGLSNGETASYSFTSEYDIPEADTNIAARVIGTGTDTPDHRWFLNGTDLGILSGDTLSDFSWITDVRGQASLSPDVTINEGSNSLTIEVVSSGSDFFGIDVVAPYDEGGRFSYGPFNYTYDNDNGGSSGYLDGPELYPDVYQQPLETASTRRILSEASFSLTANDVSNNFFVELSNDGTNFTRVNNSQSGTVTFSSAEKNVDSIIGLSRYGSRTGTTPKTGFNDQQVDTWNLFVDPEAVTSDGIGEAVTRAIVQAGTLSGDTVRECGLKNGSTLLTRHVLAEFTIQSDQRLTSSESTLFTSDN